MTNTRAIGNRYENEFCEIAERLGYATFCARGSRGPADVICFAMEDEFRFNLPPLVVQVGTAGKPIARTLDELYNAKRPFGSLCIVARRHVKNRRVSWTIHTHAGTFQTLGSAVFGRDAA